MTESMVFFRLSYISCKILSFLKTAEIRNMYKSFGIAKQFLMRMNPLCLGMSLMLVQRRLNSSFFFSSIVSMLFSPNAAPKSVTSSTRINSMPGQIALNFSRIETVISPFTVSSHLVGLIISPNFLASSVSSFKSYKTISQL